MKTIPVSYITIDVKDELPEKSGVPQFSVIVFVVDKDGNKQSSFYDFKNKIWKNSFDVAHWLKPVKDVYVLTEDEFKKNIILSYKHGNGGHTILTNEICEQYYNQQYNQ